MFNHPKFHRLAHILGLPEPYTLGHLEFLWRVGYDSGNPIIGDALDVEIAAKWTGERGAFAKALLDVRLLDALDDGRLAIHDLYENAPEYVKGRARKEQSRKRKQAGQSRDSHGTQPGQSRDVRATTAPAPAPALSTQEHSGLNVDPALVKIGSQADADRARAASPSKDGDGRTLANGVAWKPAINGNGNGNGHHPPPLFDGRAARIHGTHAWCGRVCVPRSLHDEFKRKSGKDEKELAAWYETVIAKFEGQAIGDDDFPFWRNNFAEWIGVKTSRPTSKKRMTAAEYAESRKNNPPRGLHGSPLRRR